MSFRTLIRDQVWRNSAQVQLLIWYISFDSERSQIPAAESPGAEDSSSDYAGSDRTGPNPAYASPQHTTSEYIPSSPVEKSPTPVRRMTRQFPSGCAPPFDQLR